MATNLLSVIWIIFSSFSVFHQNVGVQTSGLVRGMPCLLFQYAGTKHSEFSSVSPLSHLMYAPIATGRPSPSCGFNEYIIAWNEMNHEAGRAFHIGVLQEDWFYDLDI